MIQVRNIKEGCGLFVHPCLFWFDAMKPTSRTSRMLSTGKGLVYVLFWRALSGFDSFE